MNESSELEILRPGINQPDKKLADEIKKEIRPQAVTVIVVFLIFLFVVIFRTG